MQYMCYGTKYFFLSMKESDPLVLILFSACFLSKGSCIPFPRIKDEVITEN